MNDALGEAPTTEPTSLERAPGEDSGGAPGADTVLERAIHPENFASSTVVSSVYDRILHAVHEGRLLPGARISDSDLADQLGVSRTPVREALQRLREIGIIEASANRYTRVAVVSPLQTAQAMTVWVALYGALVVEVIDRVTPEMLAHMQADHDSFLRNVAALEAQEIATATANFFNHLVTLSENPALQRGINSVVHVIRLGSLHLADYVDFRALSESQALMLAAAKDHDRAAGLGALRMLGLITFPAEPTEGRPDLRLDNPLPVDADAPVGDIFGPETSAPSVAVEDSSRPSPALSWPSKAKRRFRRDRSPGKTAN